MIALLERTNSKLSDITWNITRDDESIRLYQREQSQDSNSNLTYTNLLKENPMYGNISIKLNKILGNYVFMHKSILNVFKYLETTDNHIGDLMIELMENDTRRHFIVDIQSLMTSEDIIFVADGLLYNKRKMKPLDA